MRFKNLLLIFCIEVTIFFTTARSEEESEYVAKECCPLMQSDVKQVCIENYAGIASEPFLGFKDETEQYAVYKFRAGYFITHSESVVFDCKVLGIYKPEVFLCFDDDSNSGEFIHLGEISKLSCSTSPSEAVRDALKKCNISVNERAFVANHNPTGNFHYLFDSHSDSIHCNFFNMFLVVLLNITMANKIIKI